MAVNITPGGVSDQAVSYIAEPGPRARNLSTMRHYYSADTIREAEAPLLASLPNGALMKRAAYGLATAIIGELTARTGGVAGRRVCAVMGSGRQWR